jgi:cephalosporin hydroxylase
MNRSAQAKAIEESEKIGAKLQLDFLSGFSGAKVLGTLQRLTGLCGAGEAYCEIGVFQGMSLVSVAAANPAVTCIGIDNYALFDLDKRHKGIVEERAERAGCENVLLIEADYEDSLNQLHHILAGKKIGVLFIDGPHDYRSQLMCLLLFAPFLSEKASIVIDDSNYAHVRQANRDFLITHPDYTLAFEKYTGKHPNNMNSNELTEARNGWWNGLNVIVRDTSGDLPRQFPLCERSRILYENEHMIHSMRYADAALEALRFACSIRPLRMRVAFKRLRELLRKMRVSDYQNAVFEDLNMTGL